MIGSQQERTGDRLLAGSAATDLGHHVGMASLALGHGALDHEERRAEEDRQHEENDDFER